MSRPSNGLFLWALVVALFTTLGLLNGEIPLNGLIFLLYGTSVICTYTGFRVRGKGQ